MSVSVYSKPKDSELSDTVAYDALNLGRQNKQEIDAHEKLCAERYLHINNNIGDIKKLIGWGGGFIFVTLIGALGYMLSIQKQADARETELLRQQVESLQAHNRNGTGPGFQPVR